MKKTMLLFLCLVLLTHCADAAEPQQPTKKENITIIGTIVGYDQALALAYRPPLSSWVGLVIRVDRVMGEKETEHYIMAIYSYMSTWIYLSPETVKGKTTWTFKLERDPECDTLVEMVDGSELARIKWISNETLPLGTKLTGYKVISMERYPKRKENYYHIPH